MIENVKPLLDETNTAMDKCLNHTVNEFAKIRAGKAMPSLVDFLSVDYYGSPMPLSQVSNISTPDARTIVIQPWEKSMIGPIEKAIKDANLGFNPQNDGTLVRINVPPLTEERRKALVKQVKNEGEAAKVTIRNLRKDANEKVKKLQKDGLPEDLAKDTEAKIQTFTDHHIHKIDELIVAKEKEIMTV